jgi:hypothetical protein
VIGGSILNALTLTLSLVREREDRPWYNHETNSTVLLKSRERENYYSIHGLGLLL